MDFLSILSLANSIEGEYLGVGYGRGEHISSIISGLESKQIPKRQFTFYDNFTEYAYGAAYDYRLNNKLAKHKNIKGSYSRIKSRIKNPLAILVLNLDNPSDLESVLEVTFKKLIKGGLLYIPQYNSNNQIKEIVNNFFDSNNLFLNIDRDENYFINSGAFAYADNKAVNKDKLIKDIQIIVQDDKPTPYPDRYIKKTIPKFIPSSPSSFDNVNNSRVEKDTKSKDRVVLIEESKIPAFIDRYVKKVIPKFIPTPVINPDAKIVAEKVNK